MNFINLTPHPINIKNEKNQINLPKPESIENIANIEEMEGKMEGVLRSDTLGRVTGLPEQTEGVVLIVSMPVILALRAMGDDRDDVYCPISRGEGVVRHPEKGFIISVPGLRTF